MPDVSYRIDYSAPPGKINSDIDKIIARLNALDTLATKVGQKLRALGDKSPGLAKYHAELVKLDAELKHKVTDSDAAEKALKKVGQGNSAVTALTKRLAELESQLKQVTSAANGAHGATSGIGGSSAGGGRSAAGKAPAKPGDKSGAGSAGGFALANQAIAMGSRAALYMGQEAAKANKDHREFLAESAKKTAGFREDLREYASLRGRPGPDNGIVREAAAFAKEASVFPEEIAPFLTNYEGSAATGRMAGNIGGVVGENGFTKKDQDALEAKLKVRGAKFATRTGLDAKTAGDLTGVVSTYTKLKSEADLAGQLGGMHYGLDQGRGEITPLARGELGQAGSNITSGRVSGLPELGAFIGVASVVSKTASSAGTTYGQASRLLNETGADKEVKKQFVEESGLGAAKGDFAKLKALRGHIAKVKPEDVNTYLEEMGYGNSTDRKSVIGMMNNVDVLEKRIAEAKRIAANGQETIDRDEANQRQKSSVNRSVEANEFASELEVGLGAERLSQGKGMAKARMMDPNQPGGQKLKAKGWTIGSDTLYTMYKFGGETGEESRVNAETVEALVKGGKQVGVDVAKRYPGLMKNLGNNGQGPEKFTYDYEHAAYEVEKAGGDPFGGAPRDAAKALRQIGAAANNAAQQLDKMNQGGAKPQGGMPPPPVGNGGAGAVPGRR